MYKNILVFIILSVVSIFTTQGSVVVDFEETIKGGVFIYYNLTAPQAAYLQLTSKSGDCDLYVSNDNVHPDFSDYTLQSATCGVDAIFIPKRYKRPIYIGVYGHPSHDVSEFVMNVCLLENTEELENGTTDLLGLSGSDFEESCAVRLHGEYSIFRRSIRIISEFLLTVEFDSMLLDLASAFAQAIL